MNQQHKHKHKTERKTINFLPSWRHKTVVEELLNHQVSMASTQVHLHNSADTKQQQKNTKIIWLPFDKITPVFAISESLSARQQ